MAGPQNNFMSASKQETIYSPSGEALVTSRPNAVDLIRTGGYRWKKSDVGKENIEDDGPLDATAAIVTVYNLAGEPVEVTAANARDLVTTGSHTWHGTSDDVKAEAEAAAAVVEAAAAVAVTEQKIADAAAAEKDAEDPKKVPGESLKDEAVRVTGTDDVAKYLEGFSIEALKVRAEEKYGEIIHHRASVATAIQKIIAFDEAAQTG